jgi:hypothetical protein
VKESVKESSLHKKQAWQIDVCKPPSSLVTSRPNTKGEKVCLAGKAQKREDNLEERRKMKVVNQAAALI